MLKGILSRHAKIIKERDGSKLVQIYISKSGDFTSITDALASIKDNGSKKKYILHISNGIYENEGGSNGFGIELKHFVDIKGESREGVIISGAMAPGDRESQRKYSTIHKPAHCSIENLTIYTPNNKYGIHADTGSPSNYNLKVKNCVIHNDGGYDGFDVGIGIYFNQSISFENCQFKGKGIFIHNASSIKNGKKNNFYSFSCVESEMSNFHFSEYISCNPGKILLSKNKIDKITHDKIPGTIAGNIDYKAQMIN
ncbi:MAG TPA: hypothetical protein VN721_16725 [Flavipsychrobacter sp.]|nr:hypothetical protein [Flavipsychrobacter sp.]